jgi:hypothetical protein
MNDIENKDGDHSVSPTGSGNRKSPTTDQRGVPQQDMECALYEQTEEYWQNCSAQERQAYYKNIYEHYFTIVQEFAAQSDSAVDKFKIFSAAHLRWRKRLVWLSGTLAIMNVVLAFTSDVNNWDISRPLYIVIRILPLVAAVFAAFIAIMSNLESIYKPLERAQAFREVREILLNAARYHEMLWNVYVHPFADSPTACINASRAYMSLVDKDKEVRGQTKEIISKARAKTGGQVAGGTVGT